MSGLIKDFAITSFIMILGHWIYGITDSVAYDFIVNFIAANKILLIATGILGSGIMLFLAAMFQSLGLSQVTFMLSKLFARLSQFFITFLSILNAVFYAAMGLNLLRDIGYDVFIVLIITLGASCWALRMIDFNYHTKNTLLPVGLIAFMSFVLVKFIWPFYGF
jgi:hypothetical protein